MGEMENVRGEIKNIRGAGSLRRRAGECVCVWGGGGGCWSLWGVGGRGRRGDLICSVSYGRWCGQLIF